MGAFWQDASRAAAQAHLPGQDAAGPSTLTASGAPARPPNLGAAQALQQPHTFQQHLLQGAGLRQDSHSSENSGDASQAAARYDDAAGQEQPQEQQALGQRGSRGRNEGSRPKKAEAGRERSRCAAAWPPCCTLMMAVPSSLRETCSMHSRMAAWCCHACEAACGSTAQSCLALSLWLPEQARAVRAGRRSALFARARRRRSARGARSCMI